MGHFLPSTLPLEYLKHENFAIIIIEQVQNITCFSYVMQISSPSTYQQLIYMLCALTQGLVPPLAHEEVANPE